jgi:MurNAc alpha-1-phosphate uridylyltransferase
MRAMILAAGRGERMGALTAHIPKPLLRVQGHYLIEFGIERLKQAGIHEIVINICYKGEQIKAALGEGERYGVSIVYSVEQERLETGGGIFQALSLLGPEPFIVMSSDIITDYPLQHLPRSLPHLGHLVMVPNPSYHSEGDFGLQGDYLNLQKPALTFASIALLHPALFSQCQPGYFRLSQLLIPAIQQTQLTGEYYQGAWYNIGTPQSLIEANRLLSKPKKMAINMLKHFF